LARLLAIPAAAAEAFVSAAPWILLGLAAAGALHVVLPERRVAAWLGGRGFGPVLRAAALGVPLPVCSCGVVPLSLALRRKGASRPATISFLITTPESGADSVALTWGMLGPVMAVARVAASLATAVATGALAMAFPGSPDEDRAAAAPGTCGCDEGSCDGADAGDSPRRGALVGALRFAFVTLLDDIAFWLVVGILLTGAIAALLPSDLAVWGIGGGIVSMLLVLAAAVPLYVCASASTPIAAALVAKGVSPGAALVFLLAGPATNAASLAVFRRNFGKTFVRTYLGGIAVGSLACGLALDAILGATGLTVASRLFAGDGRGHAAWAIASAIVLGALLVWRLAAGGFREGWRELRGSLAALVPRGARGGAEGRP